MRREISLEPEPACRPSASSEQEESDFQEPEPEPETEPEPLDGRASSAQNDGGEFEVALEDAPSSAEGEDVESGVQDERPRTRSSRPARPEYHEPQCTICNHPEREDIDQAILHWHSPTAIAFEFDLPDRRIVYRHGHALGLFRQRAEQTRHALGFLIEQAQSVVPSADAIIKAIRALSCIDDQGRWHEPRKEVVITHRYEGQPPSQRHRRPPQPRDAEHDSVLPQDSYQNGGRSLAGSGVPPTKDNQSDSPLVYLEAAKGGRRATSHSSLVTRHRGSNWSTRVLAKIRHKFNATNKTQKNGRHTFDISGDQKNRARTSDGS